jgi:D-xylose transport system permease protein
VVLIANSYLWPDALAHQYALARGIPEPPGGLKIPTGIAYPVLIMIGVALAMTFLATRRRFGRYVFAIGGNPDAAELGGINVRRTIMLTYVLMGVLCAISGAVSTARLNSAVTNLGVQNELDVISAAVMLRVDSPTQDIVVGIVLVAAVGLDTYLRRRAR